MDKGTSILVDFRLHENFNAQTALEAVVSMLRQHRLPQSITLDRDVRFVGSAAARDFPSALIRFLAVIGVEVIVCPPQRPQEKPFVERYNGTYDRECLKRQLPKDLPQAQEVTQRFAAHYNVERPHQGLACGNRPPRTAFPDLDLTTVKPLPILPSLPAFVDPDAWLKHVVGRPYVRRINQNGTIKIDNRMYYIKRALAGQHVLVTVDAAAREFVVECRQQVIRRVPIRGLQQRLLSFEAYLDVILAGALSEWRRYLARHVRTATMVA